MKISSSIWLQVIVWLGIWLIFTLATNEVWRPEGFYWVSEIRVLIFAVFFNLVYYWLLPFYFSGEKRKFFLLSLITYFAFVFFFFQLGQLMIHSGNMLNGISSKEFPFQREPPIFMMLAPPFFISLAIFGIAAAMKGFSAFEVKKQAVEDANRRRLQAEIALLKSQINPHFLLNTLNNLYSLSLTEVHRTPKALLKLSEMMKYILNECDKPKVALSSDIAFIKNYLSLQQLRLASNVLLISDLPNTIPNDCYIEPMILIPFVENAFKHGITTKEECNIFVTVKIKGNELSLLVENGLFKDSYANQNYSGIGIDNTLKRLEHSYPDTHELKIMTKDNVYIVELNIQLK